MTRQEFETRTRVNVTPAEFETINQFYMSCEADKDEFCRAWVKMNPQRVKEERENERKAEEEMARKDMAKKIYDRLMWAKIPCDAAGMLTGTQSRFLRENGIEEIADNIYGLHYFRSNFDVAYDVYQKFLRTE